MQDRLSTVELSGHFYGMSKNVTKENRYQHFVSSCSWRNRGTVPMTMHYTQESTTTTSWQVNGKVDVETDLAVAILNQLKVEFGTKYRKIYCNFAV